MTQENTMQDIACIFCKTSEERVFIEESGYKGRKCRTCGLIYISPRPSQAEILDIYGHDEAGLSAQSHLAAEAPKRLHARHTLGLLKPHIQQGDMLEIGAGAGFMLDEARRTGFGPFAIEFNPVQVEFIVQKLAIPCETAALSANTFGDQSFDLIYHCDVISHFYDPFEEFAKTHKKLKPGGFVAFETGNLGDVDEKHLHHIPSFQYPDHLFFFSENNIKSLLYSTGFDIVGWHRYAILPQLRGRRLRQEIGRRIQKKPNPTAHNQSTNNGTRESRAAPTRQRRGLKKKLNQGWHYADHFLRYGVGRIAPKAGRPQTLIVIAQKK